MWVFQYRLYETSIWSESPLGWPTKAEAAKRAIDFIVDYTVGDKEPQVKLKEYPDA